MCKFGVYRVILENEQSIILNSYCRFQVAHWITRNEFYLNLFIRWMRIEPLVPSSWICSKVILYEGSLKNSEVFLENNQIEYVIIYKRIESIRLKTFDWIQKSVWMIINIVIFKHYSIFHKNLQIILGSSLSKFRIAHGFVEKVLSEYIKYRFNIFQSTIYGIAPNIGAKSNTHYLIPDWLRYVELQAGFLYDVNFDPN